MEERSCSTHPITCSVVILLIVRRRQDAHRAGFHRPPAVHPRCLSLESFCHLHLLSSSLTPPPFRPRTFRPCFRARATNRFLSGTSPSLCSTSMASYSRQILETMEKLATDSIWRKRKVCTKWNAFLSRLVRRIHSPLRTPATIRGRRAVPTRPASRRVGRW